jgi:bla regulator protein BlaR1
MDAAANHIWQSTIVALAAAGLTLAFRRNSAAVRYWIWFAAATKFLVPFAAIATVVTIVPLPEPSAAARGALGAATGIFHSSAIPALSGTASTLCISVWMLGALLVLARWAWQWQRLAADARQSPPIVDGVVHDTLRRLEREQGVDAPTAVVASHRSIEPGVLGIHHPVLIWPQHLTVGLSDAHIEVILSHEVCHIVRRDNLLASVQMVVTALFWFHPLVWWVGARLVDERERACDERVLALGGSPATYAKSILETCRLCLASPVVNMSGVTGGNLKTRILRIMKDVPVTPLGPWKKMALVGAALLVAFAPIAGRASASAKQDADREVHKPGGRIVAPKLLREVKPQYTPRAMEEKIQGEVLLECVVKADGTVGDTKIVKSLDPDLDKEAMKAAAQWVFEPGTRDGKPVNVLVTIAMAFTLKPDRK